MTWTNTDNMIEHLQLLMEQIVEYGKWRIGSTPIDEDNSEEYEYRKIPRESEFERLGGLYCNNSVKKAVRELESYLTDDDDKKNVRLFSLWKRRLKDSLETNEHQTILEVLKEKKAYSYLGGSVNIDMIEYAAFHPDWKEHDYLKLTSLLLVDLFTLLHKKTQKLLDLYGIDETADFIIDIIRPVPVIKEEVKTISEKANESCQISSAFSSMINHQHPETIISRVHELVDGKEKPGDIARVFLTLKKNGIIASFPNEEVFWEEFTENRHVDYNSIRRYYSRWTDGTTGDVKKEFKKFVSL